MGGVTEKQIFDEERSRRDKHGKSVVAARRIPRGTVVSDDMLTVKSPGYGIKPGDQHKLVGRIALVDIEEDDVLRPENLQRSPN